MRKLEFFSRLIPARNVIFAAALLIVVAYFAVNVHQACRPAPLQEEPQTLRKTMRDLIFRNSSRRLSALAVLFPWTSHEPPLNKSVSSTSGSNDEKAVREIETVMASFRSKVANPNRPVVSTHRFEYVHNLPEVCKSKGVEMLIAVPSRVDSFTRRNAIRESWGEFAKNTSNKAVVLFFLGSTLNKAVQEKINAEFKKNGDIIQETFIDSYKNLTLKTIALVKWVSFYCKDSTYVVKADDDMYINVPRLLAKLRMQFDKGPMFIMGRLIREARPFRIKGHKWCISQSEYPYDRYPNFVSGTAYSLTTSAAMRLYVESFYVHPIFIEDVYLTGILANKASVPRIFQNEFTGGKVKATGCNFKNRISGHRNSPEEMRKIHKELLDPNLKCETK